MDKYREVKECRVCKSTRLRSYLNLGCVPLCNNLLEYPNLESDKYPIEVLFCEDCALSQLSIVVDPTILYTDYAYHSSVSQTFKDHCYDMAIKLSQFDTPAYPLVLDIASNDGCLLTEFRRAGFQRTLGVDPAHNFSTSIKSEADIERAHTFINTFWSEEVAREYRDVATQGASFITATNVLAHVDDLGDFLRGVHWFLDDKGVFVAEVPYAGNLLAQNQFDTIYHEHLSYFLLAPLVELFELNDLPIFRVEQYPIHGGSIRIYASKDAYQEEPSVQFLLDCEELAGLYDFLTYQKFSERVERIKDKFKVMMELLYHSDKKVVGYGASAKGISLLNYCEVPNIHLKSIVDDTPAKQGKITPGSLIPIVDFSHFAKEKPEFILLLAWNFAEELMSKLPDHKKDGGYFLVPIPEFKLV